MREPSGDQIGPRGPAEHQPRHRFTRQVQRPDSSDVRSSLRSKATRAPSGESEGCPYRPGGTDGYQLMSRPIEPGELSAGQRASSKRQHAIPRCRESAQPWVMSYAICSTSGAGSPLSFRAPASKLCLAARSSRPNSRNPAGRRLRSCRSQPALSPQHDRRRRRKPREPVRTASRP